MLEINVSANLNAALQDACFFGHAEIVRLLLDSGVDPSAKDDSAIKIAIESYKMLRISAKTSHSLCL